MAIKAKIKAKALGPLHMDFWSIFLASNRVFGIDYHLKKFHQFLRALNASKAYWTASPEKSCLIFALFFAFRPLFSIENDQNLGIFFLNMVGVVIIHN